MTTNVPPEPDEFQTRMRQPASEGDVEDTNRSGASSAQPATPQASGGSQAQPPQGQGQPPFAPPGFGGGAPAQPPAGYGAPQPAQQPQGQGPTSPFAQSTQSFGQQSQAPQPQPWGQQSPQAAGYGQQAPATGYPQGGPFGQQPPQWGGGATQQSKDANPLKAAFDFGFDSYATPGIVKIIYIIGVVIGALVWLGYVLVGFLGEPLIGVAALVLGWIPVLFWVLVLRISLEMALANVRTASDVRVLRDRSDADQQD